MAEHDLDILSVISRLMDYPDQDIAEGKEVIASIIDKSPLSSELKERMHGFVAHHLAKDLLDWQSEYDASFERGRSLGLWLFEHVHGESRDRGQAMVDLMNVYREAGLEIDQHELPDYIPMFLEFLATQGQENAQGWIQEVEHILGLLLCRLQKRESEYTVLFESILEIGKSQVSLEEIREQLGEEKRDDTKEAIDKEWEEEEVTFGAESLDKSCDSARRKPSESQRRDLDIPINWVDFNTDPAGQNQALQSSAQGGM